MNKKLDLNDSGVLPLKIGDSFYGSKAKTFHSIEYDFMPLSVDETCNTVIEVGTNNDVTATLPHVNNSEKAKTEFHGSQKPHKKECVLIINSETGEITLERLSADIQLKRRNFKKDNAGDKAVVSAVDGEHMLASVDDDSALPSNSSNAFISNDRKKEKSKSKKRESDKGDSKISLPIIDESDVPMSVDKQAIVNDWIERQQKINANSAPSLPFTSDDMEANNDQVEYMSDSNSSSSFHSSDADKFDKMEFQIQPENHQNINTLNEDLCLSESSASGTDDSESDSNSDSDSDNS